MKYHLVDDSCTPLGGTALTLRAMVSPECLNCEESLEKKVKFISTSQLTKSFCEQNDPELWIFGNIMMITEESYEAIKWVMENKKFVKIEFDYVIRNKNQEILCTGNTVLAFMDMKTNKPIKCPDTLLKKLGF